MSYSEKELQLLAINNPKELAKLLTSPHSDAHTLSFGAEVLGDKVSDEELVLPALRQLMKHTNAIVREGAIIGISSFYMDKVPPQDILDKLKMMATNDPSTIIKDFSKQVLKEFNV